MKKVFCMVLAFALVMCLFAGCGKDAGTEGGTALKIGTIGPLTGDAAQYGNATKNGAELAAKEINAKGGVQIEIKAQDDENDTEKSVNAYNNLLDWGMQVLVGPTTTTPSVAVAAETNKDRVFMLTPSASAVKVTEGKDNVYQICFNDPNQGAASARYISEHMSGAKVAVIYDNGSAYSTGIYQTFEEKAKELGVDVVSVSTCTEDTKDYSVQIADAKNAGADVVFLPIYYTPASLILNQANAVGYQPTFFGVDGMDGILTLKGFDTKLAEGVMLLTPFAADSTDEATASFVKAYKEAYGETPNQFAADAYDCVYAVYQAFTAAGLSADADREAICTAMIEQFNSMSFSGLTGADMVWKDGQVDKAPFAVVIKDGVYTSTN